MAFSLNKDKSILTLTSPENQEITFYVSRKIPPEKMHMASLNVIVAWSPSDNDIVKIKELKNGWKMSANGHRSWRKWWIKIKPKSIIFPTREGEFISNPNKIPNYGIYSLSYPGTASSKCVVLFTGTRSGIVVGSKPNLNWAKISIARLDSDFILQLLQDDGELYVFPFDNDWRDGVTEFRKVLIAKNEIINKHKILNTPRFLLQMGIRDYFGNATISKFSDLMPLIDDYRNTLGPGNIIHLFGTNQYGFDSHFPDFTIDEKLGGFKGFSKLIEEIHKKDLLVSHHFNPRIADSRWIEKNPEYKEAIVMNPSETPWVEFYKNNIYYAMNPNNKKWLNLCLEIIRYLKSTGIDFVEIDQIAYQRNLYTPEGGFGKGYQKLLDLTNKESIKFWAEGVSDIFRMPPDCYFQVLPRDRMQLWETNENRRGYAYGTQHTIFYRTLMPNTPISYQVVTEKAKVNLIPKRLRLARKLNTQIYDLELGFVDKMYKTRLDKTLKKISKFLKK